MKRFGSSADQSRSKMDRRHLFEMRLHLMIIMVKARMEGYPTGNFRREAILRNAEQLHRDILRLDIKVPGSRGANHLFKERVKLLCVMASALVSDDYPLGIHRREAVLDNIESIIAIVFPRQDFSQFHTVLKAA